MKTAHLDDHLPITSMDSWDAMKLCIGVGEYAKSLANIVAPVEGVDRATVSAWTRRHDKQDAYATGWANPIMRVARIVHTVLRAGRERKAALAPIRWLAEEFGGVFVELPQVEATGAELYKAAAIVMKEHAEFMARVAATVAAGKVTVDEARRIRKEFEEAMASAMALMMRIERAVEGL